MDGFALILLAGAVEHVDRLFDRQLFRKSRRLRSPLAVTDLTSWRRYRRFEVAMMPMTISWIFDVLFSARMR
ncbi:hypothetical protein DPMN_180111 [Dreissena polymorpha]|uniref:Uncharacterized protein n=1 Tax=Dreissena polymorpha TaxID=45954 RepID=A0A9D4IK64_DREPO|nr:hypothetical protein DPMN_180111 [Dreissena polymorpha]